MIKYNFSFDVLIKEKISATRKNKKKAHVFNNKELPVSTLNNFKVFAMKASKILRKTQGKKVLHSKARKKLLFHNCCSSLFVSPQ